MANTLFTGKVYQCFDELPSTNDYLLELLAKSKPPEGMAIRAASQSAGRGQYGSRWESTPGQNLTLSVLFYPNWLAVGDQFFLSMAVALAVRDTVEGSGWKATGTAPPPITVKWPNDIYVGSKKVAGILIQNSLQGHTLQATVVGIGLNVNQRVFSDDLPNPTSMALVYGREFVLEEVVDALFENLERRYLQLKAGQQSALKTIYEDQLFQKGVLSKFVLPDGTNFSGIPLGVTDRGLLCIQIGNAVHQFETKAVKLCL